MNSSEITDRIKAYWNETSNSEWYRSLRTDEKIAQLKEKPESAFHPAVYELIRRYLPDLKGKRILLPSSGDNHAAFALAMMGAQVTSADISERQLENAAAIAGQLGLEIEFVCDDTMTLSRIPDQACDIGIKASVGTYFCGHVCERMISIFQSRLDNCCSTICLISSDGCSSGNQ